MISICTHSINDMHPLQRERGRRLELPHARRVTQWCLDSLERSQRVTCCTAIKQSMHESASYKVPTQCGPHSTAEAAVEEQAKVVRDLKEGKGLTNADEEVKAAVAELLARKEKVERVQRSIEALQKEVPLPSSA